MRKKSEQLKYISDSMPKMPKRTATQKLAIAACNALETAVRTTTESTKNALIMYAKGLIESLAFDDDKGAKNE